VDERERLDLLTVSGGIGGVLCLKYAKAAGLAVLLLERKSGVGASGGISTYRCRFRKLCMFGTTLQAHSLTDRWINYPGTPAPMMPPICQAYSTTNYNLEEVTSCF